ncbi:MAG: alpha/beta fold hydrolase [Alphaproteobacteria bacterium]|nr:alpha/beta fold hydrolase [Alphaproteobacteria bacterium]
MKQGLVIGLVLICVVLGGWILAVRSGAFNPSDEALRARYTDERSRFITIDDVPMHVVEDGEGPVLVLIHGHLGSNRQWDGWVEDLKRDYRIVRFDYPPFGLSGPIPGDQYSSSLAYPLVEGLLDELGHENFHIGGTSSGSILALRYAADHPERVGKLLLSTVPAYTPGDRLPPPWGFRVMMWISDTVFEVWRPQLYWRLFMENIFGNDDRITVAKVREYTDLNNRMGSISNVRNFIIANSQSTFDLKEAAARISMPTLIQWAGKSPVLTADGLNNVAPLFTGTDVKIIRYPTLGHKLMMEDPQTTVADARAFLEAP